MLYMRRILYHLRRRDSLRCIKAWCRHAEKAAWAAQVDEVRGEIELQLQGMQTEIKASRGISHDESVKQQKETGGAERLRNSEINELRAKEKAWESERNDMQVSIDSIIDADMQQQQHTTEQLEARQCQLQALEREKDELASELREANAARGRLEEARFSWEEEKEAWAIQLDTARGLENARVVGWRGVEHIFEERGEDFRTVWDTVQSEAKGAIELAKRIEQRRKSSSLGLPEEFLSPYHAAGPNALVKAVRDDNVDQRPEERGTASTWLEQDKTRLNEDATKTEPRAFACEGPAPATEVASGAPFLAVNEVNQAATDPLGIWEAASGATEDPAAAWREEDHIEEGHEFDAFLDASLMYDEIGTSVDS